MLTSQQTSLRSCSADDMVFEWHAHDAGDAPVDDGDAAACYELLSNTLASAMHGCPLNLSGLGVLGPMKWLGDTRGGMLFELELVINAGNPPDNAGDAERAEDSRPGTPRHSSGCAPVWPGALRRHRGGFPSEVEIPRNAGLHPTFLLAAMPLA